MLTGLILLTVGAKWRLIQACGSDLPYMDQWVGEWENALQPWLQGRFDWFHTFWHPHNEHRIGWTRFWSLGLTLLNGQWDPLLAATLNAVIHAATGAFLLWSLRDLLKGFAWWLAPAVLAGLMALSHAWENTLFAFQIQFYLQVASGLVVLWGLGLAPAGSIRWWAGLVAGLLGFGTTASAFLAPAVAFGLIGLRAFHRGRWSRGDTLGVTLCALLAAGGLASVTHVPVNDGLRAENAGAFVLSFLKSFLWPVRDFPPLGLFLYAPLCAWLWTRLCAFKAAWKPGEWMLLGLGIWIVLQCAAFAYGRGGGEGSSPSSRYLDNCGLLLVIDAVALGQFLATRTSRRFRTATLPFVLCWSALVAYGLRQESLRYHDYLHGGGSRWRQSEAAIRNFLRDGDLARLKAVPVDRMPSPRIDKVIRALSAPELRPILPAGIRPPQPFLPQKQAHFTLTPSPSLPTAPPGTDPLWSSDGLQPSNWESAPLPVGFHILRIRFAADSRLPVRSLRLMADTGRELTLSLRRFAGGDRWQSAHFFIPDDVRTVRLVAEAGPDGRALAFTLPVEVGTGSWLARQALKSGPLLAWLGGFVLLAGLILGARSGSERQEAAPSPVRPS